MCGSPGGDPKAFVPHSFTAFGAINKLDLDGKVDWATVLDFHFFNHYTNDDLWKVLRYSKWFRVQVCHLVIDTPTTRSKENVNELRQLQLDMLTHLKILKVSMPTN